MIRKILLIRPNNSPLVKENEIYTPPLGLLYLAATLKKRLKYNIEIEIVDMAIKKLGFEEIKARIARFAPDLVGLSVISTEAQNMHQVAKIAKEMAPGCITVIGGPHASCSSEKILEDRNIDFVVKGEGEETFYELIKGVWQKEGYEGIKGLAFRKEGQYHFTGIRPLISNLDEIPFPAWELVDIGEYQEVCSFNGILARSPYLPIFTSRGCPYHCIYCHNIFGKRFRGRSPQNVVAEIEWLQTKYGVREIHIIDDIFNLDINRAKEICDLIIKKELEIKIAFPNGLRGDIMDEELLDKLAKAGTYSINYAVETASKRLQKLIRKQVNLAKLKEIIAQTRKKGIIPSGFFMLGFPTETEEEMKQTIKFADSSRLLKALFFSVVPWTGTRLFQLARENYPDYDFKPVANFDQHYFSKVPFYTQVTGVNLIKIQKYAWRKFYLYHPTRIIILFLKIFRETLSEERSKGT